MELKEFIAESLKQIVDGVWEAQEYAVGHIATSDLDAWTGKPDGEGQQASIEFDIAVTVGKASGKEGKAGISISPFGLSGKASKEQSSSTVSRLNFKVPITYPVPQQKK